MTPTSWANILSAHCTAILPFLSLVIGLFPIKFIAIISPFHRTFSLAATFSFSNDIVTPCTLQCKEVAQIHK
jgi:hypothetical protein